MAELKIGIIGAGGRMGQANIRQVIDTDDCILVAASDMPGETREKQPAKVLLVLKLATIPVR